MRASVLGIGLVLFIAGCTAGRVATWEKKGIDLTTKKGDDSGLLKQADALFAQRESPAKLREALKTWERAAALNPTNASTFVKLSRGYYFLADGTLSFKAEDNDQVKQEMLQTFEKGVQAAEKAMLVMSPEFARQMKAGKKIGDALDVLKKNAAGAIYWYAVNLGKFARAKGLTTALYHKNTVKKAVSKVLALNPQYWHGGPDRYFGAYYSYLSSLLGGDMKKSRAHFDSSLRIAPNYFGTKVLMAELYAKRKQDRKMFEKLLNEVIKGDPNSVPGMAPEQKVEQRKAKIIIKKADDIF